MCRQHTDDTQTESNSRWYKTPGTKRTKRRPSPAGERGVIDAAPASLRGRNPTAQFAGEHRNIGRPSFPWGTKPRGTILWRAQQHPPPQIPFGGKTLSTKDELLLGDETLGTEEELPLGGETPGTTTTDNAQPSRVWSKNKTKMTPNHQG